jgi:hypothetical protein
MGESLRQIPGGRDGGKDDREPDGVESQVSDVSVPTYSHVLSKQDMLGLIRLARSAGRRDVLIPMPLPTVDTEWLSQAALAHEVEIIKLTDAVLDLSDY